MDLTAIKGLGPARREKLEAAGVKTVHALAKVETAELAEKVGLSEKLITDFHQQARDLEALDSLDGLGEANLEKLVEADVRSLKDLSAREVGDLHEATGIPEDQLKRWRRQAGPKAAAEAVKATATKAKAEWENARVVLQEGISDARIKLKDDVVADVRILPLRAKDNVDKVLEQVKGNVVVLRERADTAMVRIEDQVVEGVPLFKEKLEAAQDRAVDEAREVRVRVQEIRDKRVLPEAEKLKDKIKGLFSRS